MRLLSVCCVLSLSLVLNAGTAFGQCATPEERHKTSTTQTCGQFLQFRTYSKTHEGSVKTSCLDGGIFTQSSPWVQIGPVSAMGQCGSMQDSGPPVCEPSFSAVGIESLGDANYRFSLTGTSYSYTTSGCDDQGSTTTSADSYGEGCQGNYCCSRQQECTDGQRDWDSSNCRCYGTPTPIIIDVAGNGYNLTSAQRGVRFDMTGDGNAELVSWTSRGSDDAFLVLDRNGNGAIDGAVELFSHIAPQNPSPQPNGFEALRLLDVNGDGRVNANDPDFAAFATVDRPQPQRPLRTRRTEDARRRADHKFVR